MAGGTTIDEEWYGDARMTASYVDTPAVLVSVHPACPSPRGRMLITYVILLVRI